MTLDFWSSFNLVANIGLAGLMGACEYSRSNRLNSQTGSIDRDTR